MLTDKYNGNKYSIFNLKPKYGSGLGLASKLNIPETKVGWEEVMNDGAVNTHKSNPIQFQDAFIDSKEVMMHTRDGYPNLLRNSCGVRGEELQKQILVENGMKNYLKYVEPIVFKWKHWFAISKVSGNPMYLGKPIKKWETLSMKTSFSKHVKSKRVEIVYKGSDISVDTGKDFIYPISEDKVPSTARIGPNNVRLQPNTNLAGYETSSFGGVINNVSQQPVNTIQICWYFKAMHDFSFLSRNMSDPLLRIRDVGDFRNNTIQFTVTQKTQVFPLTLYNEMSSSIPGKEVWIVVKSGQEEEVIYFAEMLNWKRLPFYIESRNGDDESYLHNVSFDGTIALEKIHFLVENVDYFNNLISSVSLNYSRYLDHSFLTRMNKWFRNNIPHRNSAHQADILQSMNLIHFEHESRYPNDATFTMPNTILPIVVGLFSVLEPQTWGIPDEERSVLNNFSISMTKFLQFEGVVNAYGLEIAKKNNFKDLFKNNSNQDVVRLIENTILVNSNGRFADDSLYQHYTLSPLHLGFGLFSPKLIKKRFLRYIAQDVTQLIGKDTIKSPFPYFFVANYGLVARGVNIEPRLTYDEIILSCDTNHYDGVKSTSEVMDVMTEIVLKGSARLQTMGRSYYLQDDMGYFYFDINNKALISGLYQNKRLVCKQSDVETDIVDTTTIYQNNTNMLSVHTISGLIQLSDAQIETTSTRPMSTVKSFSNLVGERLASIRADLQQDFMNAAVVFDPLWNDMRKRFDLSVSKVPRQERMSIVFSGPRVDERVTEVVFSILPARMFEVSFVTKESSNPSINTTRGTILMDPQDEELESDKGWEEKIQKIKGDILLPRPSNKQLEESQNYGIKMEKHGNRQTVFRSTDKISTIEIISICAHECIENTRRPPTIKTTEGKCMTDTVNNIIQRESVGRKNFSIGNETEVAKDWWNDKKATWRNLKAFCETRGYSGVFIRGCILSARLEVEMVSKVQPKWIVYYDEESKHVSLLNENMLTLISRKIYDLFPVCTGYKFNTNLWRHCFFYKYMVKVPMYRAVRMWAKTYGELIQSKDDIVIEDTMYSNEEVE